MTVRPVHFVFDLDDTLYAEEDYVRSALTFVGREVADRFAVAGAVDRLLVWRAAGAPDPVATLWTELGLPAEARLEIVERMRAHDPAIRLRPDAADFLARLRSQGRDFAIVTDGRSVTQRAKIAALACLDARYISVSEEVGLAKTENARFAAVQDRMGLGRHIYVADNPAKDFLAPNRLGWLTVMLKHCGAGIHPQDLPPDADYHPKAIIDDFAELWRFV